MSVAIFSDLHLPNKPGPDTLLFIQTLRKIQADPSIHELWLLGDIFDLLVGPFDFWKNTHKDVFEALHSISLLKKIVFIEGNHDFHWEKLAHSIGLEYHTEAAVREIEGKLIFLAHGDHIDLGELSYQKWRAFIKNSKVRKLYGALPSLLVQTSVVPFGEKYSGLRKKIAKAEHPQCRARFWDFCMKKKSENFHAVFLGHSHIQELRQSEKFFYCNLGSWLGPSKSYAYWDLKKALPEIRNA